MKIFDPNKPLSILLLNQVWLASELEALGHTVTSIGWKGAGTDFEYSIPGRSISDIIRETGCDPDLVIYYDDSYPLAITGFETLDIPSIFYSVDSHHHHLWQRYFAETFNAVLVAQKGYLEHFAKCNQSVYWFPLWVSRALSPQTDRTTDVCFRGNLNKSLHPQRAEFFHSLGQQVDIDARGGPFHEVYPRAKIVINQCVKDDLNFRVFEAMASGAMLLTPDHSVGLEDLFVIGKDLVVYRNGDHVDAAKKIRYYLGNEQERQCIARQGYEKALELHSPKARARQLTDIIYQLENNRGRRYLGTTMACLSSARVCRSKSEPLGDKMLSEAVRLLQEASQEERLGREFELAVITCKYELEQQGYNAGARRFIHKIAEICKDNHMIALALIESLLENGEREAACAFAKTISGSPEELLNSAPQLMQSVREKIYLGDC